MANTPTIAECRKASAELSQLTRQSARVSNSENNESVISELQYRLAATLTTPLTNGAIKGKALKYVSFISPLLADFTANIGDTCLVLKVDSSVSTTAPYTAEMWLYTVNGWEKLLTSLDANWSDLITVSNVTTAGAATLTIAQLLGGLITRDPAGADRADVTPSAAFVIAGIKSSLGSCAVGSSVRFQIKNTADADEVITVTGGSGATLNPTDVYIKPGTAKEFLLVVTNATVSSEAYTLYDLDSVRDQIVDYAVVDTTANAKTWTAANLLAGVLLRDPTGANRTDVLPSAALLVAAIPDARVGHTLEFTLVNTADADEVITLTAGSGGTCVPSAITVRYKSAKKFLVRLTNVTGSSEAYTVYDLSNDGEKDQTAFSTAVKAASDGDTVLSAAEVFGGIVTMEPGATRTLTMPAAADLLALIPNAIVGTTIRLTVVNKQASTHAITVTASGTITHGGVSAHLTVSAATTASYLIRFSNVTGSSEAAIFYRD